MLRSFKTLAAGTLLATTTSLAVLTPLAKATPSPGDPGEYWAYVTDAEPCVPQFSVYFQLPARVIAIKQTDSCPVASQVYLYLGNNFRRLPPIVATQSMNHNHKWVTQRDPVSELGSYGVLNIEYLPDQFVSRLSQRDHRIVIVGIHQNTSPNPVAPPTLVEAEQPNVDTLGSGSQAESRLSERLDRTEMTLGYFEERIKGLENAITAIENVITAIKYRIKELENNWQKLRIWIKSFS